MRRGAGWGQAGFSAHVTVPSVIGCQGEPVPAQEYGEVLVDDLLWVMAEASGRLAGGEAEDGRADQALGSGGLVCGQGRLAQRLLDGVARCARGRSRCGPGQEQREDSRVAFRGGPGSRDP
jgi:hypothetical protein